MLKIEKVVSEQYLPLTKQQNLINFVLNAESSHMVMSQSYIQFEMPVSSATSQRLSFGQDNLPYYPICMIRRARLVSSIKGTLLEVNNLNILMHNLLWHNKTTSENMSDAIFGWGATEGSDYVHSVFTDYSGNNCVVKIPFKHLFPGDIGLDDELNVEELGTLTIMLELEPQKNLFQQVVSSRWYSSEQWQFTVNCSDIPASTNAISVNTVNPNDALLFKKGDVVVLKGKKSAETYLSYVTKVTNTSLGIVSLATSPPKPFTNVTLSKTLFNSQYIGKCGCVDKTASSNTLTVNAGNAAYLLEGQVVQISGNLTPPTNYYITSIVSQVVTINTVFPADTGIVIQYDNTAVILPGEPSGTVDISTLTVPARTIENSNGVQQQFNGSIQDITSGPLPLLVQVNYYSSADLTTVNSLTTSITNVVVNGDKTITLTLSTPIPAPGNTNTYVGVQLCPLNSNITDAVWSVNNAYCFPYRIMGAKKEKYNKMVLSQFTYEALPLVGDGNSFSREIQVAQNAYNCFLLCPPVENTSQLYSVSDGVENYRFFLNDVALSNIPLQVNTNTDLDMKMRVFNNSSYPLRNLNPLKNDPLYGYEQVNDGEFGQNSPMMFVSKIKPKKNYDGSPNLVNSQDRKNLRVELNGSNMPTKTIYFFKEEYKVI